MCSSRFIKKSKKYKSDQGEQDFETEMKCFSVFDKGTALKHKISNKLTWYVSHKIKSAFPLGCAHEFTSLDDHCRFLMNISSLSAHTSELRIQYLHKQMFKPVTISINMHIIVGRWTLILNINIEADLFIQNPPHNVQFEKFFKNVFPTESARATETMTPSNSRMRPVLNHNVRPMTATTWTKNSWGDSH